MNHPSPTLSGATQRVLREVSIPIKAPSNEDYRLLIMPRWAIPFFVEGYKVRAQLRTPKVSTEVWLTSRDRPAQIGDPVGQYLLGLNPVIANHVGEWRRGMWANFERRDGHIFLTITQQPKFYHQTATPRRSRQRSIQFP